MARKTKDEAQETRNRILDSAERVFFEKGVSQTTLADIADAAGFTRGAIYGHFKNKADVFNAMWARARVLIDETIVEAQRSFPEDPLGGMRAVLVAVLRETARNPQWRRVLSILIHKFEMTEETARAVEYQSMLRERTIRRVTVTLRKAIRRGMLPPDLDVRRAEFMMRACLTGLLSSWLAAPSSFDLEHEAEPLIDGYFDMLRLSPALRRTTERGSSPSGTSASTVVRNPPLQDA